MIGIYKITNNITNEAYIGQSVDIEKRWKQHKSNQGSNKTPLYLDFEKFGFNNFSFEILEECCQEELNEKEIFYIDKYDTYENGYNLTPGGKIGSIIGQIKKPKYKEKKVKFMYIGIEEIREAAKNLTPSALKLYIYFAENEEDWKFHLSPKDFMKSYDVAESTFRNAKKELIDKGYIVETDKNHFIFYTNPQDSLATIEELSKEVARLKGRIDEFNPNITTDILIKNKKRFRSDMSQEERRKIYSDTAQEFRQILDEFYKNQDVFMIK